MLIRYIIASCFLYMLSLLMINLKIIYTDDTENAKYVINDYPGGSMATLYIAYSLILTGFLLYIVSSNSRMTKEKAYMIIFATILQAFFIYKIYDGIDDLQQDQSLSSSARLVSNGKLNDRSVSFITKIAVSYSAIIFGYLLAKSLNYIYE